MFKNRSWGKWRRAVGVLDRDDANRTQHSPGPSRCTYFVRGVQTLYIFVTRAVRLCYCDDGNTLLSGGYDGYIRSIDMRTQAPLRAWNAHSAAVISASVLNADRVVTCVWSGKLFVFSSNYRVVSEQTGDCASGTEGLPGMRQLRELCVFAICS